jgi:hypothetical protein
VNIHKYPAKAGAVVAKTDEKVMRMVEAELGKNPDASVDELFDKAKGLNSGVARMSRRQFHARYPLQVKRKKGAGRRGRKGRKGGRKGGVKVTAVTVARGRGPGRPRSRGGTTTPRSARCSCASPRTSPPPTLRPRW